MKSILVGAVDSTRIAMTSLVAKGVPPAALLTLPVAKAARHSDFVHLKPIADRYGIPVIPITNVNHPEVLEKIRAIQPDYSFVIGWSQICTPDFLNIARVGSIGYHPAPLPENRGRAVIPWTILQRRQQTGSTLFWMDEGADSGDILAQEMFEVAADETATTLYRKHGDCLGRLLDHALPALIENRGQKQPQDHSQATYCAKRVAADGLIDWSQPAEVVWRLIRAVTDPYPGAFTYYRGHKLVIWEAAFVGECPYYGLPGQIQAIASEGVLVQCGDGQHLRLQKMQFENAPDFLAYDALKLHEKFGLAMPALSSVGSS